MPTKVTENDIIDSLHNYYKEHGKTPNLLMWTVKNGFPCNKETLLKLFGTYNNMVKQAGYKTYTYGQRHYNETELVNDLKLAVYMNRSVDMQHIRGKSLKHRDIYTRVFGSMRQALLSAGIDNRHILLLRNFNDYNGQDPVEFLKIKLGVNNMFTKTQKELIEQTQEIVRSGYSTTRESLSQFVSIRNVLKNFGKHSYLIVSSGFEPPLRGGSQYQSNDGHICDSYEEAMVDNWLNEMGISHTLHAKYPNSSLVCDFKLSPTLYVEYIGFARNKFNARLTKEYNDRLLAKECIASKNRIVIVKIDNIDRSSKISFAEALSRNGLGNIL